MSKAIILALAACVCLAAAVSAAPASSPSSSNFDLADLVCDSCKALVEQAKAQMPMVRPQLDQLCNYCGSPENNQKCLDKLHELEDRVEREPSVEICKSLGACKSGSQAAAFVDFSGQF